MHKGNLATRPFYNERLVNLLLILLVAGAVALAVFNTTRTIYLSGERASRTVVERDAEEQIRTLTEAAAKQQATVDLKMLYRLGASTAEANQIIEQRMFSWTVLLGLLEKTIPMGVRLISIGNHIDASGFSLRISTNAKTTSDLEQFSERLRGTGYFHDVFASELQSNDDEGTFTGVLEARYQPPPTTVAKADPPKGGAKPR